TTRRRAGRRTPSRRTMARARPESRLRRDRQGERGATRPRAAALRPRRRSARPFRGATRRNRPPRARTTAPRGSGHGAGHGDWLSGPTPSSLASLAGPRRARYTTLVPKHFETSDATDSPQEVRRMTPGPELVLRQRRPQGTRVQLGPGLSVGGRAFVVMAGPCAVEEGPMAEAAAAVSEAGCALLRGGAFKPRTSPY